ncbi:MerR family transcriptional regulator [Alkaliphilus hydrothermalis]|uniref:DNA-binding transcriptional MerR regulator n=1 Tax=Alkaliphilus hydrothermalis TaxID=1482730 RepID=A0ABS2NMG0_9FIRM|nr:helix-turn-helix domain-containing protein [Alkaliphilus hydrothermalis]MBM7614104.1 DNA-binding transcriptional MerR regulator [Alkaliphilus hydrothermalis]
MKNNNTIYSMKEVAEITGFKPHVIRFYEDQFQLKIPRNESNRRYFTYKEIEDLEYIKQLQDKGLTNPQIQKILKSPKIIIEQKGRNEVAISSSKAVAKAEDINPDLWLREAIENIKMELIESVRGIDHRQEIENLSDKIDDLRNQLNNQEKDVLICENAKLKMKLKEKSYEVAELKDRIKREDNQKKSVFERLFFSKKKNQGFGV